MTMRLPRGVVPETPAPGQVSVWTFPRPPIVVGDERRVVVRLGGEIIVDTTDSLKALETSHPPTWYLPKSAFRAGSLQPTAGSSVCEYKGPARYFDVVAADRTAQRAAWQYPNPWPGFESIFDRIAIYVPDMDSVTVDGVEVEPQPGNFYGGWITPDVVGPFKGIPGSMGW